MDLQVIFFDLGGTIIDLKVSFTRVLQKELKNHDIYLTEETISRSLKASNKFILKKKDFIKDNKYLMQTIKFISQANLSYEHIPRVLSALLSARKALKNPNNWIIQGDVLDVIDKFTDRYRLAIISNWDATFSEFYKAFGLHKYFEFYVCSSEVGFEKPDKRIYEWALSKGKVEAEHSLIVGNDYKHDIIPTKQMGFNTVLYDPQNCKQVDCYRIKKFSELYEMVGGEM